MKLGWIQNKQSKWIILASLMTLIGIPIVGSLIRTGSMPPDFYLLASHALQQPAFNLKVFCVLSVLFVLSFSVLLTPKWFGIQPSPFHLQPKPSTQGKFPKWFYPGCIIVVVAWFIMWGNYNVFGLLTHYMFVPLWAGFILMLDGFLYRRNQGQSFLASRPKQFLGISLLSIIGWYYFEYLNFFILKNWYYPNLYLIPSPLTYIWAAFTFACVWPGIFLIYNLLLTFPTLRNRYSCGKPLHLNPIWLWPIFIAGITLFLLSAIYPSLFFWLIWLGPILILSSTLAYLNSWTPLTALKQGNWSPILLMALSALICGFFWEFWNWPSEANNPNFWRYNLPFVHEFELFGMPILGFSGYLFFGIECWVIYIACAKLLGLNDDIQLVKPHGNTTL